MRKALIYFLAAMLVLATLLSVSSCHSEPVRELVMVERSEIEYIQVFTDMENREKRIPEEDFERVLGYLQAATPIKNSITDSVVYSEDYRGIGIRSGDTTYFYFVYKDWLGRTVVEVPYTAIYKVDSEFFDYLDAFFK